MNYETMSFWAQTIKDPRPATQKARQTEKDQKQLQTIDLLVTLCCHFLSLCACFVFSFVPLSPLINPSTVKHELLPNLCQFK